MINHVKLKNFKCFEEVEFNFSHLTLFCGTNSAGKSTAIQSILSIKQNEDKIKNKRLLTYGDLFNFGKVSDIFCHHAKNDLFQITINDSVYESVITAENKKGYELTLTNECAYPLDPDENDFVYLSAERYGPRSSFDIKRNRGYLDVGIYGQFALSEYLRIAAQPAINQKFARMVCGEQIKISEHSDTAPVIFSDALVREAMRSIYPDFNMSVKESEEIDKVHNTYALPNNKNIVRPHNVGFGVSYILPIIIAAAAIKPNGIIIIENPEVHLHPKAQSSLMKILVMLSLCDVQVILETHSDHIVNSLRVFAKENKMPNGHNTVYSITNNQNIKKINIDENGNFSEIDDDFFDQIEKDLMRLF
ncbi:DUF3696 domain-containing protein [Aeromonas veronii]|uniref:DUF3696 domain-containing protein n=1 Tax=Aeromonas veronii TaxID=654 RepID=UPI003BA2A4C4